MPTSKNSNISALYLNFIMHRPNLWHICMFLIFLGFSSSWKGKQKKIPVRKLRYNCLSINRKRNLRQNFLLFAPARSLPAVRSEVSNSYTNLPQGAGYLRCMFPGPFFSSFQSVANIIQHKNCIRYELRHNIKFITQIAQKCLTLEKLN